MNKSEMRLLIADDETGMRDLLSFELSTQGYQVSTAKNGFEALECVKKEKFHLMITDVKMPKMDGITLLESVKKIDPYLEVVVLTAFGDVETAVKAMKIGAYDFLLKPFNLDEVFVLVERALEKNLLRVENEELSREIIRRKEVEAQLEKARDEALSASKAKSEFLAMMSHEIRTPMNAILGMIELLADTHITSEQKEYVQILRRAGENLIHLINDILDLSKVESGALELDETDFDLVDLVERTGEFLAVRAHQKGIELTCNIAPEISGVFVGDSTRLRQILTNLIGNAIKFTEKGEVVVEVKSLEHPPENLDKKREFIFSVRDTGIGIPPEKMDAVFDPFTQADCSTTRRYGGSGLGLSISKRLVELMGGRIWLESKIGEGTKVSFTIECSIGQKSKAVNPSALPVNLTGVRVLVVDDNVTNRFVLREMLTNWGVEVTEAEGGNQCIEELKTSISAGKPFQLLLLDCRMPEMDGFDVVEYIKNDPVLKSVIILMLTSDCRSGDFARSHRLGIARYLIKPIKRADLRNAVMEVLARSIEFDDKKTVPNQPVVSQGRPLNILLVEDDPDGQFLMRSYFKNTSYRVDIASNGQEAVNKFKSDCYDLILMDMQMPILDGYQTTRAIREWEIDNRQEPVVIIALTANVVKEDIARSLEAGCNSYLTKPIKKTRLLEVLGEQEKELRVKKAA
ncbi:MAG: response regulator [Candidatus Omnitrophica bacterium]|nr:response regulator [Candidatus Omnitrophota bacterium]